MKGLDILKNGYLETVNNDSTSLSLLGRGNGIEMMKQLVLKDKIFFLYPSEDADVQEFFYILNGEIETEVNGEIVELGPNDFFSSKNLEATVQFTAKTDVSFLSVSTAPVFHYLSNVISALRKVGETVERKDPYTFQHSSRVANYAVKIALKMKLRKERMDNLFIASILHDIGKVNIPEEVLKKPAKLTDEEFALVKKHPTDGAAMIRETIYADLADIVEQHHERIDGSGYPFGLKGEEISLEAKIIGVADTFDAMTEDRAYRKAFSPEFAMQELKRLAGTLYDPEVVDAFEQVLYQEGKLS
ncbi:HD domain-containing phosphohydrolase [Planococcus shixiaomingii]|uniref:HD domain-containing phosphohydrolase n=1 Tax=Planococcus shixiaomingii TaxID=3058393 RepID=UPI00262CE8C7|nr:HD domain-containing phosphohydrolase [Planococcus sp. N022]WKA54339.1 HD domain-containing protein [Planococcus sp. N022]